MKTTETTHIKFLRRACRELRETIKGKTFGEHAETFKDIEALKVRIRRAQREAAQS